MNIVADTLLLFGILALGYALLLAVVRLPLFPLKQIVVNGPIDQVTHTQVEYAVQHSLSGNFFTVDLNGLRASFEKLPWVRKASVRRHWPDALEVEIEEHVAVARWRNNTGEMRLVNRQGEVFNAVLAGSQHALPLFGGPEGSAPQVLARYLEFSELLAQLGRTARTVLLSPRQAWQLRLDDGLVLELGRDQDNRSIHERIERFVGTYAAVQERVPLRIAAIDMRYPSGFALWLGSGSQEIARKVPGAAQEKGGKGAAQRGAPGAAAVSGKGIT
ncbi:MAG: cell division protein FtsQ/DivIB [Azonexus sp.]|nr:cell division protein FtsQ/DivIB [Azonexus sp.]